MKNKNEQDVLMSHNYDGIKELDNDLPPWWLWLFYITIAFAVVYMIHYHVLGTGDLMIAEYHKEYDKNWQEGKMVQTGAGALEYRSPFYRSLEHRTPRELMERLQVLKAEKAEIEKLLSITDDTETTAGEGAAETAPVVAVEEKQIQPLTDKAALEAGKQVYTINCVACHGVNGEGGIGPNMTDDFWIHGAGMNNMVHTINVGVPAKGMITWKGVLKEEQILQVASYMMTLYGTNPPNAKAPQGDKVDMQAVLNRTAETGM